MAISGVTVIDPGHSAVKGVVDFEEHEFPHLVAEISEEEFRSKEQSNRLRNPFLLHIRNPQRDLDGFFAVGDAAARGGSILKREQRYSPRYVGPMMCSLWAAHYSEGTGKISEQRVTALFPAGDSHAVGNLTNALSGNWTVTCANDASKMRFTVRKKNIIPVPEPMGGLYNIILDKYGNQDESWRYADEYNPIIIDIGGGTLNVVELGSGFQYTDPKIGPSHNIGVNDALEAFITRMYEMGVVKSVVDADRNFFRTCLREMRWRGRGRQELVAQIEEQIHETLEDLMGKAVHLLNTHDIYAHSHAIVTGGGGALLSRPLLRYLTDGEEELPEEDGELYIWAQKRGILFTDALNSIQFANARGARKSSFIEVKR